MWFANDVRCVYCDDYFEYKGGPYICPECKELMNGDYDPEKYFIYPSKEVNNESKEDK
jgi:hypothetical protein